MLEENKNLISIDELITKAKSLGVDFGKGNPRNRLRYYTKIGLLPHAQRKSFNNQLPNGAYPEEVLGLLLEIDKKLEAGKSIRTIKREIKEEKEKEEKKKKSLEERLFETPFAPSLPIHIFTPLYTSSPPSPEIEEEFPPEKKLKPSFRLPAFLKPVFIVSIFVLIVFFANAKINFGDSISYFLASVSREVGKLVQLPPLSLEEEPLFASTIEPYLTINAETAINGPLNAKESVSSPVFILTEGDFKGLLALTTLTADRAYTFPDQSGMVCLSTGNCIGLGGEISGRGTPGRLAKFISAGQIANSSIADFYEGVVITISRDGKIGIGTETPGAQLEVVGDTRLGNTQITGEFLSPNLFVSGESDGKVGIKTTDPKYDLDVKGRIQATGDICTDIGGKCLSQVSTGAVFFGGGGISGSGSSGYLPIWTGSTALGNSIVSQSGTTLDVAGTLRMTGFQLTTGATSGYILTSDGSGIGTWQSPATDTIPVGTTGQTLRHDGTSWLADSFLYNTGSAIGIGTTSTLATLTVSGDGYFQGPLTIATTTLPQLVLEYGDDNYLKFSLSQNEATISASSTLVINSLTGEVRLANNVTDFYATSTTIRGATFVSAATDSTVRKSGEKVFRASVPIFKFPISSQTASTSYVAVTKEISTSTLNAALLESLPGTTRKFTLLINFADDILTTASSTWLIDLTTGTDIEFTFAGQELSSLSEGVPHMSQFFDPPSVNWQLKVRVPLATNNIRIFNIFLLVFDQIN